jgi:hypothetical protein
MQEGIFMFAIGSPQKKVIDLRTLAGVADALCIVNQGALALGVSQVGQDARAACHSTPIAVLLKRLRAV